MKTAVIMHVEHEGPGSLGKFLESINSEIRTVRLYDGESLPHAGEFDAIISMGGPMNVYEEENYPFLSAETAFLKEAIQSDIPVLGICLGAQMIAKAAGAEVVKSPKKEVGWGLVDLTDKGRNDLLFAGMPEVIDVLQWHEDMFLIPEQGELLASSAACPHQAFRLRNAYGLQFHLEITEEILKDWFGDHPDLTTIIQKYHDLEPILKERTDKMYNNLLSLVKK